MDTTNKQKTMRIVLMLSRCDLTGMTTNTLDLYSELKRINKETFLVVGVPAQSDEEISGGGHYAALRKDPNVVFVKAAERKPGIRGMVQLFMASFGFARALLKLRPDIIHCESPYYTFIPWLLRKKFVSTMHVCAIFPNLAHKRGSHLIAISEETFRWGVEKLGFKKEDITTVPHGVSPRFSERISEAEKCEVKRKYGIPEGKILIGLVGSIERRKGHDILLEAFSRLPEKVREQAELVFVGSEKSRRDNSWLLSEIARTGMEKYVRHIEYTAPEKLYKIFDIFVLPSRLEGFALVVIEAMLSGNCVVRSNTEGASMQIEDGVHGRIFQNENVAELSEILAELIENKTLRERLAEAGRERALREFTSDVMAKKTLAVYEKVLNESRF